MHNGVLILSFKTLNVIAGGGWERYCKKLSDQKKGKERMKQLGQVQIPKEAFINVLRR